MKMSTMMAINSTAMLNSKILLINDVSSMRFRIIRGSKMNRMKTEGRWKRASPSLDS
jgi:hypothetical protein